MLIGGTIRIDEPFTFLLPVCDKTGQKVIPVTAKTRLYDLLFP